MIVMAMFSVTDVSSCYVLWVAMGVGFLAKRNRDINLPAPYLKRVWIDPARVPDREAYPFCLPFLGDGFELSFERAITIIVGENGTGKSTLLEGIAALAGFDSGGGRHRLQGHRSFRSHRGFWR
jgi:AAA domain